MNKVQSKSASLLGSVQQLDALIFLWMMKRKRLKAMARLCRILSRTADGYWYVPLALGLFYWSDATGGAFLATVAIGFAMERPLYFILKQGLKRNRPASSLPDYESFIIPSDQFSFPSGHTSGAFLVATALWLYFPETGALAYGWATLVGFSRITLGVHFPSDTAAGAAMGGLLAVLASFWISG